MTDTPERPASRFDLNAIRARMGADAPIRFLSTPQDRDDIMGMRWVRNDAIPENVIVGIDPAGGPDQTVVVVNSFRETEEQAAERQRLIDNTMRQMGEALQYPASHVVRMGTVTGRTSSRDPAESNPPRRSVEEICADIANPDIPLPAIIPEVVFRDYDSLLPRGDRAAPNYAIQSQASDEIMQRLHRDMRELASSLGPVTLAVQGAGRSMQHIGRVLREAGDRPPAEVIDAADQPIRRVGFAQRILRRAAETRAVSDFPVIVEAQGVVDNDGQPISSETLLAAMNDLTRPRTSEERRLHNALMFGTRYGMGRSRLAEMDFSSLEQHAMLYLDTEASFNGLDWGIFGSKKRRKDWVKPPKGSLKSVPGKAPMGRTYAAIMIESAIHIIGTVPAMGTLIGDLDRPIRFSQETKPVIRRSEVQHSIPHSQSVTGHVVLLNDFLTKVRGKRVTSLHDEWDGKVRAVMFDKEITAKSVRGFKKV